jgi:hypothetical protein
MNGTSPYTSIGRVGALAVFLGVGIAKRIQGG